MGSCLIYCQLIKYIFSCFSEVSKALLSLEINEYIHIFVDVIINHNTNQKRTRNTLLIVQTLIYRRHDASDRKKILNLDEA